MRLRPLALAFCLGHLLAGCNGADAEHPAHLDFDLPDTLLGLNPADMRLVNALVYQDVPKMICAGPLALESDCCAPSSVKVPPDCRTFPITCDLASSTCAIIYQFDHTALVDLAKIQAMVDVRGRVFSSAQITHLSIRRTFPERDPTAPDVLSIREAVLYVGPPEIRSASDPEATPLAYASLRPGDSALIPTERGQQAFSAFVRDYYRPFTVLLSVRVVLTVGALSALHLWLKEPTQPMRDVTKLADRLAFTVVWRGTAYY